MRNALYVALCTILILFFITCNKQSTESYDGSQYELMIPPVPAQGINIKTVHEPLILSQDIYNIVEEYKLNKYLDKQAKEIEKFWRYYYPLEIAGGKLKKPWPIKPIHEKNFKKFSRPLAEVVYYYQHNKTDLGGILPKGDETYLFFAMMVAKETAVIPTKRGKIGEVGLIQVHGPAQNGWTIREILDDPRKGLIAGVKWMTSKFKTCRKNVDYYNWETPDWQYPLSIYAAGEGNGRVRKGNCTTIRVAIQRVNLLQRYLDYRSKNM